MYEGTRDNIVGLLLVKTLIKLDPEDATPVRSLLEEGNVRPILHTSGDKPLFDLLNEFQDGRGMYMYVWSNDELSWFDFHLFNCKFKCGLLCLWFYMHVKTCRNMHV